MRTQRLGFVYAWDMNRKASSFVYSLLVLITAGTIGWSWVDGVTGESVIFPGSGGRSLRTVDQERFLRLFQEGKLSDREALYYRKILD